MGRTRRSIRARLRNAGNVAPSLRPSLEVSEMPLEVRRPRGAQRGEARMNLATDRAAMGAAHAVGRQQSDLGRDFVEELSDGKRVPDLGSLTGEAMNQDRRRQQQDFRAPRRRLSPRRSPRNRGRRVWSSAILAATTRSSSCR